MQPETKYAKSGDLHIAYQVIGDGPVDLVVSPGFISHLDLNWTQPAFPRYVRRLASFARVILFDKRGTGLSDPTPGAVPIDERMDDIRAVMDAVGSERAALFGYSEGGPMSILFAATYPERTHALVLYGTYAHNAAMPDERWEQVANAIDHWGEGIIARLFVPSFPDNALNRKGAGVYERAAASPAMARALIEGAAHIDVRSALSAVQAPTLVIHRRGEFMPVEAARELAAGIPQARYIELPGTDHLPWVGDMDAILDPVEEFLTGAKHRADPDRVLATVLFTDIVEGTARAASIGDDQWRETLERHNTLVRRAISEHRGVEVKTTGDGFLATFDGPARAIRSALEIVEGVRELGLEVRAG
ncbi:MAG TPA: adenylate/guanylate cyclase domain-containing protein, partial [Actinomycetota bacterium]|nr:adenylate/guanylate cyclase domain-containing protein [Actinomycetota bacterium]